MKPLIKRMFLVSSAAIVCGSAVGGQEGWTPQAHGPTLVGAWQFEMTVRADAPDCTTSPPITFGPNPFPGLATFHEGGTLNEYASRTPPSIRTTGFGSWKQTGKFRYKARRTFLEFDPNGLLWRTMVTESRMHLAKNGNRFTDVSRLELTDVSGNVLKLCATVEAVRFTP